MIRRLQNSLEKRKLKECFQEYGVAEASNGENALEILKKPNEIDLMLLDVRMSGMDGIEVLDRARKLAPDARIVILTGYGSKDIAVEALRNQLMIILKNLCILMPQNRL